MRDFTVVASGLDQLWLH